MPDREFPYGAFNFQVSFTGDHNIVGGFSDVSGIGTELMLAEYRNGNDANNHVRKIAGLHKVTDVTLKRGIIDSATLWAWLDDVRSKGSNAAMDVTIELRDETNNNAVQTYKLRKALPMKWTGPTLAAKAHGDVAMEELTLACEGLEFGA